MTQELDRINAMLINNNILLAGKQIKKHTKMKQNTHVQSLFLWCMSAIYFFAFSSLYFQVPGKIALYIQCF